MVEFIKFPKIPRCSRLCIITEKIDGTNGCIYIPPISSLESDEILEEGYPFYVGSRTRWITPESDNHGFAKWAYENAEKLLKLGEGRHFGEWWGQGINRGYELKEKRFSLFNVTRWNEEMFEKYKVGAWERSRSKEAKPEFKAPPTCCSVVPVVGEGEFETHTVELALDKLAYFGSLAAPGYRKPEGVVIYHVAGNVLFKKTLEED